MGLVKAVTAGMMRRGGLALCYEVPNLVFGDGCFADLVKGSGIPACPLHHRDFSQGVHLFVARNLLHRVRASVSHSVATAHLADNLVDLRECALTTVKDVS